LFDLVKIYPADFNVKLRKNFFGTLFLIITFSYVNFLQNILKFLQDIKNDIFMSILTIFYFKNLVMAPPSPTQFTVDTNHLKMGEESDAVWSAVWRIASSNWSHAKHSAVSDGSSVESLSLLIFSEVQ
jgi:hypothetical protein